MNRLNSEKTKLSGPQALQVCLEEQELWIRRLEVRLSTGDRHEFREVRVPLPAPNESVFQIRLGFGDIDYQSPDRSDIHVPRLQLRLLAPGENDPRGELPIGIWQAREFKELPAPADRFDSSGALERWSQRILAVLRDIDSRLMTISLHLSCAEAPLLTWQAVLAPCWFALSAALDFEASDNPDDWLRRLRGLLRQISLLGTRASQMGDPHLSALAQHIGFPVLPDARSGFADECDSIHHGLEKALESLVRLKGCLRGQMSALPDMLYHQGRIYRREAEATLTPVDSANGHRLFQFASPPPVRELGLAVLWERDNQPIEFGEVAFFNEQQGRRMHELFLDRVEPGQHHWVVGRSFVGARFETPGDVRPLTAALYAVDPL